MRTELPHAEIEAAIAQVLEAERDAEAEVARCKAECASEIARAKRQAEEIAASAEHRIASLNRRRTEAVDRQIADLEAAVPVAAADRGGSDETAVLLRAAEALARELTGAGG